MRRQPGLTPTEPSGSTDEKMASVSDMTPAKITALIRLLADDDPKIIEVVTGHLREAYALARPLLEQHAREGDPQLQRPVRQFLLDMKREEKLREWGRYVQCGSGPDEPSLAPGDLETGAFLIAAVEYPDLDMSIYRKQLDDMANVLDGRIPVTRDPEVVVAKLNHLLFRELGLQGNRENYYDPQNSYLPKVLERKIGIPISLSIITMLVAGRCHFNLQGIGLPGHFLLRYRSGKQEIYIDPYNGGRIWSIEDCLHYLRGEGYGFREEYLRAYSTKDILTRMLANLFSIFRNRNDEQRARLVTTMLEVLQ